MAKFLEQVVCGGEEGGANVDSPWFVAYTRPRCEKKLARYCEQAGFSVTLPCLRSVRQYRRKKVEFNKPLFPGYVFFRCAPWLTRVVQQNQYVARVLYVPDQRTFEVQLEQIMCALQSGLLVVRDIRVDIGTLARIKAGPLVGISGKVVKIVHQAAVVLSLNFIGQGAAVLVDIADLEIAD